MATYSRVKTFVANETLTASDLNTEFNNIITNTNSGNLNSDNVSTSAAWTWTGYHTYSTSSRIVLADNIYMTLGNATDGDYRLRYNSSNTALELTSTNSDGSGTDAVVMDVQDGTDDVRIRGGLSTNNNAAPTSGIVTGGNIVSDTDGTDDLGTTSVRWANLYVDAATITNNLTVGGTLTLTGGLTLNGNVTVGDSASDTLTINSTITSNLIFTDNTYDIGASGATRPRDLHLSRNALMGGTLSVTGLLTATAGVTSGSNIVSDTDSTDDLGTTSVRWANLYVDSIGDTGQALAITAGSNNVNVTAGTLALTGAQTISSTLGVTGLITASGGVSGTTGTFSGNVTISKDAPQLIMTDSGSGGGTSDIIIDAIGSNHGFYFRADGATNHVILESNGDFKVDANTLYIDASEDRVGINESNPQGALHIDGTGGASNTTSQLRFSLDGTTEGIFGVASSTNNIISGSAQGDTVIRNDGGSIRFSVDTGTSVAATLDSTGLGVGTNSPSTLIHAEAADGAAGGAIKYTATGVASGYLSASPDGTVLATDTADITFRTGVTGNDPTDTGAEAVRIKSTGMGVLCSPSAPLAVASKASSYEGMELVTPSGDGSGKFQFGVHDLGGSAGRGIEFRRGGSDGFDTLSLAIDNAGNLGVGVSPTQKLHVAGDVLIDTGTTSTLYFDANTNWMQLISGDFRWGLASTEYMRLDSSGRLKLGGTTNNGVINNIGSVRINIDSDNNGSGEYFAIGHNQESINANNELFRVQDDGRVGINESSPQADFHVNNASTNGVARISTSHSSSYAQLQLVNQSGNYWYQTIVQSDNSYRLYNGSDRLILDASGNLKIQNTSTDSNPFFQIKNDAREYNLQVAGARSDNFEIYDNTAGTQRLTILSDGKTGIGTNAPGAPLEIVSSTTNGQALFLASAASGTEGSAIRSKGSYTVADGADITFNLAGNASMIMVADNNTGDGAMFLATYKSATITLIADPNGQYATTPTSNKTSLFKSANTMTVSLSNDTGGSRGYTILKVIASD